MNPFLINNYVSPAYFCDRERETELLIKNIENQSNTALFAQRRIGKSALIKQVFYLKKQNFTCIYIDIFASRNLQDFANILANGIYQAYEEKKKGKLFLETIKLFRPVISLNELSGNMEITLDITKSQSINRSVPQLLTYLEKQNLPFVVAIDEFQQILTYPEKNVEAILRTSIQTLKNVQFIFCGSHLHLMSEIFNNAKRPFFASCSNLFLSKIENQKYHDFIKYHFEKQHYTIEDEAIELILEHSDLHTYYVQKICHELYAMRIKKIKIKHVHECLKQILLENEMVFFQYRTFLSSNQWDLLKAIALEEKVSQPYSNSFIKKYNLSVTGVKRALSSLMEKDMIFFHSGLELPYYEVQDKFLRLWLQFK